ncbi:DoxX family protein [Neorhizobium galegae]|uniref:DoxX family protein n=1 Tax=Neorhizobium galegae TaxID=399 RepID=A0A6A1TL69_NEOGA|nr:DoxX family protein [Neorhizobium galegae]KAB1085363.1 DoxX family protein [Neorhizobium galegae]
MNSQLSKTAAAGRLLIALLFLLSGLAKIADPAGTLAYIGSAGLPLPYVSYAGAVAVEVVGGILLVLGYRTRLVALVVAVYSVAAAIGFHTDFADQNQMIHFLKNLAVAGGLLQIVSFGAGAFSLDARKGETRAHAHRNNGGGAHEAMTQI